MIKNLETFTGVTLKNKMSPINNRMARHDVRLRIVKSFMITFLTFILSGCSKPEYNGPVLKKFSRSNEIFVVAKSATRKITIQRCCAIHSTPFSYIAIRRADEKVIASISTSELRQVKIFSETIKTAPNCIPFLSDEIESSQPYYGQVLDHHLYNESNRNNETVYEYCPVCEKIMHDALKKGNPDFPEINPMVVTDHHKK